MPVQVHYLLESCSDYVKAAVNTVVELHREDVPGDVLVFLTGQVSSASSTNSSGMGGGAVYMPVTNSGGWGRG